MMQAGQEPRSAADATGTNKDYGVRVIRPFLQFSPGFVMYPTAIYREKLVRGGFVEAVEAPQATGEELALASDREEEKQPRKGKSKAVAE